MKRAASNGLASTGLGRALIMTKEITRNPSDSNPVKAEVAQALPVRGEKDKAPQGQLVTFILTDKHYVPHRTIEGAKAERDYLTAKTGKEFKLLKVICCSSDELLDGTVSVLRDGVPFTIPRKSS